jgi:hypothetical protein
VAPRFLCRLNLGVAPVCVLCTWRVTMSELRLYGGVNFPIEEPLQA